MQTAAESAQLATNRVRASLESDRRGANEQRLDLGPVALRTVHYQPPLWLRLKRRWREDERMRLASMVVSVALLTLTLIGTVSSMDTARARQLDPSSSRVTTQEAFFLRQVTPAVSHQPEAALASAEHVPSAREGRDRLATAQAILRDPGPSAALEARALLAQVLRVRPASGRAYAALAEACRRLDDERCARSAVARATALQPRRAKYLQLAQRVESTFAP